MPKWCDAKIISKQVWTEGLFTLRIAADDVNEFQPGQFLQLAVKEGEEIINRPYSVASPSGNELDFFIVVVPEGQLTPRLWKLEPGDSMLVAERAAGSFTLKKTPDAESLWLVSTGTGLAPYIAMLRTETPWERYKKIVVVHGVRHAADFGYAEELREMEAKSDGQFSYIQTLTREDHEGAIRGRIPGLLENGSLEEAAGMTITDSNASVLLCGNPAMLDDMEAKLGDRGLKRHRSKSPGQIVLERYW